MATPPILGPLRHVSENAFTSRTVMSFSSQRPGKVGLNGTRRPRPKPLDARKFAGYRKDLQLLSSGKRTPRTAPYTSFPGTLTPDYEPTDEGDTRSPRHNLDQSNPGSPTSTTYISSSTTLAATPLSPLQILWEGRSVPAVRVGRVVMPVRREPTETKLLEQFHVPRPLDATAQCTADIYSRRGDFGIEHVQHANTVHSGTNVIAELYGLSPKHKVFPSGAQVPFKSMCKLGWGSLGVVEEVRTSLKKRSFVRKQVQIPYRRTERLKIVEQEAAALRFLTHQHIVQLIGTYEEGVGTGRHFYSLLMTPVGDNDLRSFLDIVGERRARQMQTNKLFVGSKELTWMRTWFPCLASAVAYMHRQGIRHQDIKPSNIIHRGPDVFFTDFSSSCSFDVGKTKSTETPARNSIMYAAPETVKGPRSDHYQRHGPSSDIFSLGCVFAEMLTVLDGRRVFDFQEFCLHEQMASMSKSRPKGEETWGSLLYSRSSGEVERWFDGTDPRHSDMYQTCIKPMLDVDRDKRPSADTVLARIRTPEVWTSSSCSCS